MGRHAIRQPAPHEPPRIGAPERGTSGSQRRPTSPCGPLWSHAATMQVETHHAILESPWQSCRLRCEHFADAGAIDRLHRHVQGGLCRFMQRRRRALRRHIGQRDRGRFGRHSGRGD